MQQGEGLDPAASLASFVFRDYAQCLPVGYPQ
jgi:hypothetical protein